MAVVSAWALWLVGLRCRGPWIGFWAAAIWLICYQRYAALGFLGQPEVAAVALSALIMYLALNEGPFSRGEAFGAGLILALLAVFKPPFILFGLLLMARGRRRSPGDAARHGLLAKPALALVPIVGLSMLLWGYFASLGATKDLIESALVLPLRLGQMAHGSFAAQLDAFATGVSLLLQYLFMPFLFALAGVALFKKLPVRSERILLSYAALAVILIPVQGRYFTYHWICALAPMSLFAALGADGVATWLRGSSLRRTALAIPLVLALLFLSSAQPRWDLWKRYRGAPTIEAFWATVPSTYPGEDRMLGADVVPRLAKNIKRQTADRDTVFAFNTDPGLNIYSSRRSPTRFFYVWPLQAPGLTPPQWQTEFAHDVMAGRPKFIMVCRASYTPHGPRDDLDILQAWPELGPWFNLNYVRGRTIGSLELYRLR